MNENRKSALFIILLLVGCVIFVAIGFWRRWKIEKSHKVDIAQIYNYTYGGRGNAGRLYVDFTMNIKGKEYKSSSGYLTTDFNCNKHFLGKTFPVVYNPDNPSISSILIIPEDFARYGYSFPDSLKWVLQYKK